MTRRGGEATRRRLLEEAIRLFGKNGYQGTSLESVAGAAGVRKQTLLYYFPSKESLLEACVAETSVRLAAALSEALEAETSSSRKAEAVIHTIFRLAEEWPEFPPFLREASRLGPEVIERFAATLEPLRLRALAFLARGMSEGEIRRQDPALLLFTLYTAVIGTVTEAGVLRAVVGEDRSRMALHRREREVMEIVRNALAPAERESPPRRARRSG
ncbi:MAG: TetR/AcrR family transcriptional regulator [Actinobacteria bacterium]|nr:MAG: TetR/AcrR family transcriptional regulator [Actinomycetota bacterium]